MKRILHHSGLVLLPVALWALIASFTPRYLVARPHEVLQLLVSNWHIFTTDTLITLFESVGGLVIAFIVSFTMAIAFQIIPRLQTIVMPYAIAMKSIPIVAIAPLLVMWFGNGLAGKIVLAALICFFPIIDRSDRRYEIVAARIALSSERMVDR